MVDNLWNATVRHSDCHDDGMVDQPRKKWKEGQESKGGRRRKKRAASIGVTRGYETRTASHMASPPSSTEPSIQFVPAKGMLHEAPDALSVSPPGSVGMLGAQRPSLQGEGREGGGVDGGTDTVREDRNNPQGSCAATGRTAALSDSGAVVSEALRAPDSNAGGSHLLASETESHLATHPSPFPSPPIRLTAHRCTCPIHTPIPVSPPPLSRQPPTPPPPTPPPPPATPQPGRAAAIVEVRLKRRPELTRNGLLQREGKSSAEPHSIANAC